MTFRSNSIVILTALTLVLGGCGVNNTGSDSPTESAFPSPSKASPSESSSPSPSQDQSPTILNEFRQLASSNPSADKLVASLKKGIGQVRQEQADEMMRALESYYVKNLPELEKKFDADNVQRKLSSLLWPIDEQQIDALTDDSFKQLLKTTIAGGYKLETSEGYFFPIVDYGKLLTYGDQTTSTAMKAYLGVLALESDNASAGDGGLIISLDELEDRALAAESYVVTFPDTPERTKVEDRFVNYLSMYLIGLDNTPIFDYETFHLLPEVKKQYEQMAADHGGTVIGQLTEQLLQIAAESKDALFVKDKNGEQKDIPAVKQFRDQLEAKARSLLAAGKK
ncbi:hypothetical protein D7Z26_10760 [Cohnella endophytica]|uniref:Uncharacterized protein n=1 Tax=Cohnella endophytica TaxID=2419778 RepID=A0A494XXX0_9BACL|nr:hypothetical protein [Cohnella endophytica]RKP53869.1 hypothetical protein D7Z26_10760 [Cohnella endophytica]